MKEGTHQNESSQEFHQVDSESNEDKL